MCACPAFRIAPPPSKINAGASPAAIDRGSTIVPIPPAALFVTVSGLKLPIACMTSILAATALLLLSQDRSAGSRIFAAALLCCCSLAGAVLGGAVVSLAFLARGEGEPLMSYLPKELQRVYPPATIAELQSKLRTAAPQHMLTELPPQLLEQASGGCIASRPASHH